MLIEVLGEEFNGVLGCDYFRPTASTCGNATCWCSSAWRT